MKFALFFRFFDSWYIIKYLFTNRGWSAIEGPIFIYSGSQTVKTINSKEINEAESEYMNMGPLNYRSSAVHVIDWDLGKAVCFVDPRRYVSLGLSQ